MRQQSERNDKPCQSTLRRSDDGTRLAAVIAPPGRHVSPECSLPLFYGILFNGYSSFAEQISPSNGLVTLGISRSTKACTPSHSSFPTTFPVRIAIRPPKHCPNSASGTCFPGVTSRTPGATLPCLTGPSLKHDLTPVTFSGRKGSMRTTVAADPRSTPTWRAARAGKNFMRSITQSMRTIRTHGCRPPASTHENCAPSSDYPTETQGVLYAQVPCILTRERTCHSHSSTCDMLPVGPHGTFPLGACVQRTGAHNTPMTGPTKNPRRVATALCVQGENSLLHPEGGKHDHTPPPLESKERSPLPFNKGPGFAAVETLFRRSAVSFNYIIFQAFLSRAPVVRMTNSHPENTPFPGIRTMSARSFDFGWRVSSCVIRSTTSTTLYTEHDQIGPGTPAVRPTLPQRHTRQHPDSVIQRHPHAPRTSGRPRPLAWGLLHTAGAPTCAGALRRSPSPFKHLAIPSHVNPQVIQGAGPDSGPHQQPVRPQAAAPPRTVALPLAPTSCHATLSGTPQTPVPWKTAIATDPESPDHLENIDKCPGPVFLTNMLRSLPRTPQRSLHHTFRHGSCPARASHSSLRGAAGHSCGACVIRIRTGKGLPCMH